MNTKHLLRKLPGCLLGALFVAGVTSTTMVKAVDGNPPGLFELEGNVTDEAFNAAFPYTEGDDWESLFDGTALSVNGAPIATTHDDDPASSTYQTLIVSDPAPKSIFTQGGSKDVNDVSEWKTTDGAVPDKDDITHAFAAAYINPTDTGPHKAGDMIIYFGLDRYANNGDANAGFWFFQEEVSLLNGVFVDKDGNPAKHVEMRPNPAFGQLGEPEFLPGDVFVIVKYPQDANSDPVFKAYEWDPNDADGDGNKDPDEKGGKFSPLDLLLSSAHAKCDQSGSKVACAITNLTDLPEPSWGYMPKSGTGLPFESIFEGGINITNLLGSSPCFASFLAETRSSESQTAQLKDLVLAQFPVCGIDVSKQCNTVLNEGAGNVTVNIFGELKNSGASSYIAYLKDSVSGATIDAVCVDTGDEGCDDDTLIPTTSFNGGVYFTLGGGVTVRYEGHYTTTGLPTTEELTDTMTAEAYSKAADIGVSEPIVDDEATANCSWGYIAGLEVTKNCDALFVGGTGTTVHVTGTVKNTGNVPLTMSALVDSTGIPVAFDPPLTDNILPAKTTANYKGEKAVSYASLILSVSADQDPADNIVTKTVTLQHKDKVTATGKVIAGDGSTLATKVEVSPEATCGDTFLSSLSVLKECDGVEVVPVGGKVVVKQKVKATVTNLGDEALNISSLVDDPALEGGFSGVPATLAKGANFIATGFYYPSAVDGGATDPGTATFSDKATVSASGASSSATLGAFDNETCALCPD